MKNPDFNKALDSDQTHVAMLYLELYVPSTAEKQFSQKLFEITKLHRAEIIDDNQMGIALLFRQQSKVLDNKLYIRAYLYATEILECVKTFSLSCFIYFHSGNVKVLEKNNTIQIKGIPLDELYLMKGLGEVNTICFYSHWHPGVFLGKLWRINRKGELWNFARLNLPTDSVIPYPEMWRLKITEPKKRWFACWHLKFLWSDN